LEIRHSLDPQKFEHAASNCQACHANVHSEQVELLRGQGAKSLPEPHSGMAAAGISCSACHQEKEISASGATVWKASAGVCIQCHEKAVKDRVLARQEQFKGVQSKIEADLSRVREALSAAKLDQTQIVQITNRLQDLSGDLQFLRVGNSIHNMHYAGSLLNALVDKLRAICVELKIPEPVIELPKKFD